MTTIGRIIGGAPETNYYGSVLTAAAGIGDTVLHVDDVGDFDEDAPLNNGRLIVGALLDVDGVLDVADASLLPYVTCDDDEGTVTLVAALTEALEVGDVIYLYDPATEDAVADAIVYVEIEGADLGGDALPAVVSYGVLGKIGDSDNDANGLVVTLEEDEDGQLVVTDVHGSDKPQREVKFHQDQATVAGPGLVVVQLTFQPMPNSEHVYWNGVYQPGMVWSRDEFLISIPDDDGLFEEGDLVTVEYAYIDPKRNPIVVMPCDVAVALPLRNAKFLFDGVGVTGPFGQYDSDEDVIWTIPDVFGPGADSYPEFYFPGVVIEAPSLYLVRVKFSTTSSHPGTGRSVTVYGVRAGDELRTYQDGPFPSLHDGFSNTDDEAVFVIGPGIEDWDDPGYGVAQGWNNLWFETDKAGVVESISVERVCTTSTECLIPGDVYTNGTIHGTGVGGDLWAEDPATDTGGDTTGATLVDSGSTKSAHGWIPALTLDPASVVGGVLKFYGAAYDTGDTGDPDKAYVAFEIGFTGGATGSSAPFSDLQMTIELPNDPTLTPVYREFPLSTILSPTMPEVWARLTRTDPGHTGPRCLRFVTNGFETPDNDGTLTVDVWSARICLDYIPDGE